MVLAVIISYPMYINPDTLRQMLTRSRAKDISPFRRWSIEALAISAIPQFIIGYTMYVNAIVMYILILVRNSLLWLSRDCSTRHSLTIHMRPVPIIPMIAMTLDQRLLSISKQLLVEQNRRTIKCSTRQNLMKMFEDYLGTGSASESDDYIKEAVVIVRTPPSLILNSLILYSCLADLLATWMPPMIEYLKSSTD